MLHSVITGHIKLIEQSRYLRIIYQTNLRAGQAQRQEHPAEQSRYLRIIYQTNLRAGQAQRQEHPAEQSSSDDHRVF